MSNNQDPEVKISEVEPKDRIHSADDIIVKEEMQKLGKVALDEIKSEPVKEEAEQLESEKRKEQDKEPDPDELPLAAESETMKGVEKTDPEQEGSDEYGNEVKPKKLYSEEEVQRMIRERLQRGRQAQETQTDNTTQVQPTQKPSQTNQEEGAEDWETQLKQFIVKTNQEVAQKEHQRQMREAEDIKQANFEIKFTQGMEKYSDFRDVVEGKPVTPELMLAVRSMDNPAAFIYAACKQYPKEIERINAIADPFHKAAEVGRLEERMKKAKSIPSSPKPSTKIVGDAMDDLPKEDMDSLILAHAKSKIIR